MCGIAGIFDYKYSLNSHRLKDALDKMTTCLSHRGPDASGFYVYKENGLGLGHRRLSILDVSESANQPFVTDCGSYALVFNGEVYNYKEIREELILLGHSFKTQSDTEVVFYSIIEFGVYNAVEKFTGMFSIAFWDSNQKRVFLIRDRMGEKPLYWSKQNDCILFSSELKSFVLSGCFKKDVCVNAQKLFFKLGYIPAPYTIYSNTYQVKPGHVVEISIDGEIVVNKYWSVVHEEANNHHPIPDYNDAKLKIHELLIDSITKKMRSDVSLGAFLSGGIDSSLVVAIMQRYSEKKIKTFTIGFNENEFNEAHRAKEIAKYLGTDHKEKYLSNIDLLDSIEKYPKYFDEPFSDVSLIPTMQVSSFAKLDVSVVLSGDGGDELFAGYNHYQNGLILKNIYSILPLLARKKLNKLSDLYACLPESIRHVFPSALDKPLKILNLFKYPELHKAYISMMYAFDDRLLNTDDTDALLLPLLLDSTQVDVKNMQLNDILMYLPNDILTKVDRSSMAYSLEARSPLLDHNIVEYAMSLPLEYKIHGGVRKRILKDILYEYVPKELTDYKKTGFDVPIKSWLRGDLSDWADSLLTRQSLMDVGCINVEFVTKIWQEHKSSKRNWHKLLWRVLSYQIWSNYWLKS